MAVCAREGLVSVHVVAGDETKVMASASMAAKRKDKEMNDEIDAMEEVINAEIAM